MLELGKSWLGEELQGLWEKAGVWRSAYGAPERVSSIAWDTRLMAGFCMPDTLFVALRAFRDGHYYGKEAIARGAKVLLVEQPTEGPHILVSSTRQALYAWATAYREALSYPLVAIAGYVGKTWVKEWLAQLVEGWRVYRSPGSFNSWLGIPLSLLHFGPVGDVGLVEVAVSKRGEMAARAALVRPQFGILMPVLDEFPAGFSSLEVFLEELGGLFASCAWTLSWERPGDWVSTYLPTLLVVGESSRADFRVLGRIGVQVHWRWPDGSEDLLVLPSPDKMSYQNSLLAAAAAYLLGLPKALIRERLPWLSPLPHRRQWLQLEDGRLLLNDSYQADVSSTRILLEEFQQMPFQKKSIILGEVAPYTPEAHQQIQQALKTHFSQADVHLIGSLWAKGNGGRVYPSAEAFLEEGEVQGEAILLKGGHRSKLYEKVLPALLGRTVSPELVIDLSKVAENLRRLRARLAPQTKIWAVLKAAAYGQGVAVMGAFLERQGIAGAVVAFGSEALALRKAGFTRRILVLYPEAWPNPAYAESRLEVAVGSWSTLRLWAGRVPIHLEIDTGMGRMGFLPKEIGAVLDYLANLDKKAVQGVFSHLANPSCPADPRTQQQLRTFEEVVRKIWAHYPTVEAHLLSTMGVLHLGDQAGYDGVRIGIGLYGAVEGLVEATALYAPILRIRQLEGVEALNYGFRSQASGRVATVALGYGDGLLRAWAERGTAQVYIKGEPAKVLPPLNMDVSLISLPASISAQEGDLIEIWGSVRPLRAFAAECQTIPYEILVRLSSRVRRHYQWGT